MQPNIFADTAIAEMSDEEKLALSIDNLQLTTRAYNVCRNSGIATVEDLIGVSEKELRECDNCGKITVREIKEVLSALGFSLRRTDTEIGAELADTVRAALLGAQETPGAPEITIITRVAANALRRLVFRSKETEQNGIYMARRRHVTADIVEDIKTNLSNDMRHVINRYRDKGVIYADNINDITWFLSTSVYFIHQKMSDVDAKLLGIEDRGFLSDLCDKARKLETAPDVTKWLSEARGHGIEPLGIKKEIL